MIREFIPGLLPRDLGLKGFDEIRGIHLGSCPGWDTYQTTPYYTQEVSKNHTISWIYQPKRYSFEGAHTHLHPADPYYLHICFWDAGYVKTNVLIHEYCHVLWALQEGLKEDNIYKRFGERGIESACHNKEWQKLMEKFGEPAWEFCAPKDLDAKYYVD